MPGLRKLFGKIFYKPSDNHISDNNAYACSEMDTNDAFNKDISTDIKSSRDFLGHFFKNSSDLVFNEFVLRSGAQVLIAYIDGLVNVDILNRDIIHSFISIAEEADIKSIAKNPGKVRSIISSADVSIQYSYSEAGNEILSGNSAIFIDGMAGALIVSSKGFEKRNITEPSSETVVRGPKESFVENLRTCTSMLRRKVRNNNLVIESLQLGKQTKTRIEIAYIHDIAKMEVVEKVKSRLIKINTDSILGSGYIEQYIEDHKFSLFPTIWYSEKPDVIAGKLLEGRVAIFCDGTPHVLTVPTLFIEYFQSSEDYYVRPFLASITRTIRIICFFITVLLPALYVALQTFHQEMVPAILLVKMSGAMSGIPFPTLLETLLMIFFYEVLREAGIRMPRVIGPAISIVGALVMGESAVNAGLVSATIVIVIALTAICSFAIPELTEPVIILRILFVLLAGVLGLFGVACGVFATIIHLVSLSSFGANYTSSIAPFNIRDIKDLIVRFPLWSMRFRPATESGINKKRRGKE